MNANSWGLLRGTDWKRLLMKELDQPYWDELERFIEDEYSRPGVYPPLGDIFAALHLTRCAKTKVVIVGQDPYPRAGWANGLAFAVPRDVEPPGSLANIYRELHDDVCVPIPDHGNLESWGHEGVLLLNSTLTVRPGSGGPHKRIWKPFTDAVIRIAEEQRNPIFILWGSVAQKKTLALIDESERLILSSHPSRRSAHLSFFNSEPFSRCNCVLVGGGGRAIDWRLTPY